MAYQGNKTYGGKKSHGSGQGKSQDEKSGYSQGKFQNGKSGYGRDKSHDGNKSYGENKNSGGKKNFGTGYVGAPYNFVSLSKQVYEYKKEALNGHHEFKEEGYTGEIAYEITAETPIIVDSGKKDSNGKSMGEFHKNAEGKYSIPGSTMRGLIRSNVQILGLSSIGDDIDDYNLMYRNVVGGLDKEKYNKILGYDQVPICDGKKNYKVGVLLKVRAGYVKNKNGKYVIYQTNLDSIREEFKEMNYYVLSERNIVNDYLQSQELDRPFSYDFFLQNGKSILQHEFVAFRKEVKENRRVDYIGVKNKAYKPYIEEISYEIADLKDVTKVGMPGKYKNKGYVVSTGAMNKKKAVYIIPEIDMKKESIEIPKKDAEAFKIDINKRENSLKQFGGREFFDLPEEGKMRPVFYFQRGNRIYFGFTPRLRMFYDNSIKEGLSKAHKGSKTDYCKAMFGFTSDKKSFKSRLSFSDAVVSSKTQKEQTKKVILAEPKPTSYLDYLKAIEGRGVTYNNDDFELRGIKQYWLHEEADPGTFDSKRESVASRLSPLEKGTKFTGKVRFQNLTKDELGLLLWSMQLKPESQMNVGKAKAFGYGRISLKIKEAKVINLQKAYNTAGVLDMNPYEDINIEDMIGCYKETINKFLGTRKIDELLHIKEFFMMKDSSNIPKKEDVQYMSIKNEKGKNEYQNRKEPLPTVSKVWNKKK